MTPTVPTHMCYMGNGKCVLVPLPGARATLGAAFTRNVRPPAVRPDSGPPRPWDEARELALYEKLRARAENSSGPEREHWLDAAENVWALVEVFRRERSRAEAAKVGPAVDVLAAVAAGARR